MVTRIGWLRWLVVVVASFGWWPMAAQANQRLAEDVTGVYLRAANKTMAAEQYQASTKMILSNISAPMAEALGVSTDDSVSLFDLTGTYDGGDSATWQRYDPLLNKDGSYPTRGFEMIVLNGNYYLHGPAPEYGAPEDRWYTGEDLSYLVPQYDQRYIIERLMSADLTTLSYQRNDAMDNQKCQTYTSTDRKLISSIFSALSASSQAYESSRFYEPALGITLCEDGYVHRLTMNFDFDCGCKDSSQIEGREEVVPVSNQYRPQQAVVMVTYHIEMRFRNFNAITPIRAPAQAAELSYDQSSQYDVEGFSASVFNGGNIRAEPNLQGKVLGQIHAGQRVVLLYRTADFRWFYISSPEAIGWVSATLLTFDREVAEDVPIYREESGASEAPKAAEESNAGSLNAVVYNGGNLREAPNTSGRVLDQINAKEQVALLGKRGSWYKITNIRGVTGWVHQSLLTVDSATAAKVPQI